MSEPIRILIAEDNAADRMFIREMLHDTGIAAHIDEVEDGAEALAFLKKEDRYASCSRPQLIILDLNMPRIGGEEFLQKASDLIDGIEVVIFSGSPRKVVPPTGSTCRGMVKPSDNKEFEATIGALKEIMQKILPR